MSPFVPVFEVVEVPFLIWKTSRLALLDSQIQPWNNRAKVRVAGDLAARAGPEETASPRLVSSFATRTWPHVGCSIELDIEGLAVHLCDDQSDARPRVEPAEDETEFAVSRRHEGEAHAGGERGGTAVTRRLVKR